MTTDSGNSPASGIASDAAPKALTPAAERALAEATERRARNERERASAAPEVGGRGGPDPVRYGDWENKGIVSDF